MPNFLWFICAPLGHDWVYMGTTKNWIHQECNMCDKRRRIPR